MLERVDRMLMAVRDRAQASRTFANLLGAQAQREFRSIYLNAQCAVLAVGETELELCEPVGDGPIQQFISQWGEGLFAAGFCTSRLIELSERFDRLNLDFVRDDERIYLPATSTAGVPMVISDRVARPRIGPVSFFYEATNALQSDWRTVAARYAEIFDLDPSRFSPIASKRFGYQGTLTMFDPVRGLDRIELSQTFADQPGAMRRFVERRGGDCLNMCYLETHDFEGLKQRLLAAGAPLTARGESLATERDNIWVHPKGLHGMLLGISRTGFAWDWSGQPQRVPQLPGR